MILLDVRKKAVIDQANYIKKEPQNIRKQDIPSLIENIRSLKEIQYKLEVTCGIKDTYLNQQTKIVNLGDSDNKINPNMFIGDYSSTAIHSSVIGNINEEDLFYLMSRGVSYDEAVKLCGLLVEQGE